MMKKHPVFSLSQESDPFEKMNPSDSTQVICKKIYLQKQSIIEKKKKKNQRFFVFVLNQSMVKIAPLRNHFVSADFFFLYPNLNIFLFHIPEK